MRQPSGLSASIRDHFLADHGRLERLLEQLVTAVEANDREDLAKVWTEVESGLLSHLDAEEEQMIPALPRAYERDARVLIQEHRHIRTRLTELGEAIDLHIVRLDTIRDFIDVLRAHARNEDKLLYNWTDAHLKEPHRASAVHALTERVREGVKTLAL
jgi:hypothetical protein